MTSPIGNAADRPRFSPELRRVTAVVILGAFMAFLDSTVVNIALRSMAVDLDAALSEIQWVITAYLLAMGAVIPATGWAARRFGARRTYLVALGTFTAGSLLCGLAGSSAELIGFRVVQGIGGGLLLPVGQMILTRLAGRQNMARVMSALGMAIVIAPVLGPTLGGLLVEDAGGWQAIFYFNLPVGVVAMVAAVRLLPRDGTATTGPLDVPGLLAAAAGLVGLTYGLARIGVTGRVDSAGVLVSLCLGVALLVAFVVRALSISHPLLDLRLYRNRAFAAASLATFCVSAVLYGGTTLMPLYFQTVRHQSVIATGLLLVPAGVGALVANWIGGRAVDRFGGGRSALFGTVVATVTTVPFALIGARTSYLALAAAMAVRGLGIGMSMMPVMTVAYRVVEPAKISDASPQISILQRAGGSLGTAIFIVVLQHHLEQGGGDPAARATAFGTSFWWVFTVTAITVLPAILLTVVERRAAARVSPPRAAAQESSEAAGRA